MQSLTNIITCMECTNVMQCVYEGGGDGMDYGNAASSRKEGAHSKGEGGDKRQTGSASWEGEKI